MLVFPDFPEPNIPAATNCGSSFKHGQQCSTISTETDGNYEKTRPRATRQRKTWTYAWNAVTDDDYEILLNFFEKVGSYAAFYWDDPDTGLRYMVRFTDDKIEWQHQIPFGWTGALNFKEV